MYIRDEFLLAIISLLPLQNKRKWFHRWLSQRGNDFVVGWAKEHTESRWKFFNTWISLPNWIRFSKSRVTSPSDHMNLVFAKTENKNSRGFCTVNFFEPNIALQICKKKKSTKSSTLKTIFIITKESLTWVSCQARRSLRRCSGHRRRIPRLARGRSTTSS